MSTRQYYLTGPKFNEKHYVNTESAGLNATLIFLGNKKATKPVDKLSSSSFIHQWWLVIPCLLLTTLASAPDALIMNDFLIHRYERQYGLDSFGKAERSSCQDSSMSTAGYWYLENYSSGGANYNLVQQTVGQFNVKNSLATLIPSIFAILLLGSNCDTIGRRPLLFLSFVGKVGRHSLMLVILARDLSDAWLLWAHAFETLFGSNGIVMLSSFAYITDCTEESNRTRPFFVVEVIMLAARVLPILAVGVWLNHFGYIVPTSVALALSVIGMIYSLFVLPESVPHVQHESIFRQLLRLRLKPIIHCMQVFLVKRPNHNQQYLILISIVNILVLFMLFGYSSILTLFAYGRPFCMDALTVGLLISTHALAICVFSGVLFAFKKEYLDQTYTLPIIGLVAFMISLFLFAFSRWIWLLYIAVFIGSLFFITMPVLRTKLSRLVEPSEYAIVFIAAALIEIVGDKSIGAASNAIYDATLSFWPGLVFLVFAIIGLFPLLILCYLAFMENKATRKLSAYINSGSL